MNRISIQLLVIGFALLLFSNIHAQTPGDYRSRGSGDWGGMFTWQTYIASSWTNTSTPPDHNANGVITIRNGHTITISGNRTIDQVVIENNGELLMSSLVGFVATLNNGSGTDLQVQNGGRLTVGANATLSGSGNIENSGTFLVNWNGTVGSSTLNHSVGTLETSGAIFQSTTITNNGTMIQSGIASVLNLNNTTLTNNGTINFTGLGSNIGSTGGGVLINSATGTLFNSNALSSVRIGLAVALTNNGLIKGYGEIIVRNPTSNAGIIAPGNADTPSLIINPALVTGKTPTFNFEVSGALLFDQIAFNNTDATSVDISGATLTVTDNSASAVTTSFTIFTSTVPIIGTFASVNIPPTLGSIVYNTNSIVIQKIAREYTWTGASSSVWTTSTNWSPTRSTPSTSDILVFNGGSPVVTGVITQTVNAIVLRNNATVLLQPINSTQQLSVGTTATSQLSVEPGSSLTIRNNGIALLNININSGARASIGGTVLMDYGTFNINNNLLQLYASASPLQRNNGQFAIGSGASIEFGTIANQSGPILTLPDNIFTAPPTVSRITVNRINGVVLGNQTITVDQQLTLTSGNLTTNASGKIRFSASASNPIEIPTSKIIGYAEMQTRTVNTSAVNFLGLQLAAGSDIGTASITRITGPSAVTTFNGNTSIAASWETTTGIDPLAGRLASFSWFNDFDNSANTAISFLNYHYQSGPGWGTVGPLSLLASSGNPRSTIPVLALKLTGLWTLADQLNALPITLADLKAEQVEHSVQLNWITVSEQNGDYFEVQRLENDGETFIELGTVKAKGFSKEKVTYRFTDDTPVAGDNYYRLKMVDLDQTYEYSRVIKAVYKPTDALTIYPNPATNEQYLTFTFPDHEHGRLSISDIYHKEYIAIPVKGTSHKLELSTRPLPTGIYLVRYTSNQTTITKKLMIN